MGRGKLFGLAGICGAVLKCAMFIGGCQPAQGPAVRTPLASQPNVETPLPENVPVVYEDYLRPNHLTAEQISEILRDAMPSLPTGHSIWFIRVTYSRVWEGENSYKAFVYFTPDRSSPRLRTGRYVKVSNGQRAFLLFLKQKGHNWLSDGDAFPTSQYWQVSDPSRTFGDDLEAPEKRLWPFWTKGNISQEDIVALVDLARANPGEDWRGHGDEAEYPILGITKTGETTYEIETGHLAHGLAGHGCLLNIVKEGKTFRLKSSTSWLS